MRTLGLLIRTNFLELVGSYNKKGKNNVIVATIVLIFVALFMIGLFGIIGGSTAFILQEKGLSQMAVFISISMGTIIALMFGVANSTRDAKGADTDMLLAMPIPKSHIVISKLLGMYLLDSLCSLVLMLPTLLIIVLVGGMSGTILIRGLIFALLIPAIPLFISLVVSAIITFLKRRTKFGQIFSTIVSLAVMALYMFVVPNLTNYAENLNISPAESVSSMKKIPPLYWLSEAIYSGNWKYLVLSLAITLIPLMLAICIHARSLNGIEMHVDNSKKALKYKSSSVGKATFKMEFTRYFSSSNYVMNTIFGTAFLVILTGIVFFKGLDGLSFLKNITIVGDNGQELDIVHKLAPISWSVIWVLFINAFGMITYTTPPSVSVEGKRIWISKTLPIATKKLLDAKILVSLLIYQPISIICSILLGITSKSGFLGTLFIVLITSAFQLLTSMVGLIFGLIFAKLDWKNEAQVIKSGWGVTMGMLTNCGIGLVTAIPLVVALLIGNTTITISIFVGLLALILGLCVGAYAIITHYGVRKYESLNG